MCLARPATERRPRRSRVRANTTPPSRSRIVVVSAPLAPMFQPLLARRARPGVFVRFAPNYRFPRGAPWRRQIDALFSVM